MTEASGAGAGLAGSESRGVPEDGPGRSLRVVQRVVFPGADLDVVPLYVETNPERGAAELAAELLAESLGNRDPAPPAPTAMGVATGETQSVIRFGVGLPAHPGEEILPRRSAAISGGGRVSFATYFNAFPASYWRRWTTLDSVTLRIRVAGECAIILYRSAAKGHSFPVETIHVETDEPETVERVLPLAPFIDGGWYWFDIVAGPEGTTLVKAEWAGLAEPAPPGRLSLGFTTFNRPDFMVEHLRALGAATEVFDLLDAVYVVDQGTKHVADHPDYADAAKRLGDKLRIIQQGNIGGSGGFSRSMDGQDKMNAHTGQRRHPSGYRRHCLSRIGRHQLARVGRIDGRQAQRLQPHVGGARAALGCDRGEQPDDVAARSGRPDRLGPGEGGIDDSLHPVLARRRIVLDLSGFPVHDQRHRRPGLHRALPGAGQHDQLPLPAGGQLVGATQQVRRRALTHTLLMGLLLRPDDPITGGVADRRPRMRHHEAGQREYGRRREPGRQQATADRRPRTGVAPGSGAAGPASGAAADPGTVRRTPGRTAAIGAVVGGPVRGTASHSDSDQRDGGSSRGHRAASGQRWPWWRQGMRREPLAQLGVAGQHSQVESRLQGVELCLHPLEFRADVGRELPAQVADTKNSADQHA